MYGPQKTVRNMTTKDNPTNLYAADSLTVQPLDFTVLSETAATLVTCTYGNNRDFVQTKLHCLC